jgi:hypothetical protein
LQPGVVVFPSRVLAAHVPILRFAFSSVKVVRHIKQISSVEKNGGHAGVIKKWSTPSPAGYDSPQKIRPRIFTDRHGSEFTENPCDPWLRALIFLCPAAWNFL